MWKARGEKEEEYSSYLKSVECFGKAKNAEKEIKAIDKCVEICLSSSSFSSAASLTKKKAEIEKKKKKKKNKNEKNEKKKKEDAEEVVGLFSLAEDYFSMSKEASEEEKNALKEAKADCIVEFELKDDFDIAKFLYDEVGAFWAKKHAAKYRAPHYFGKVVLLQLAYDEYITSKSSLQKYLSKFSSLPFSSSPLWLLSEKLVGLFGEKKCGNETGENFAGVVGEYKKKAEWDDWAEIVVGRIKEKLDEVEKEFENGGEEEDFK